MKGSFGFELETQKNPVPSGTGKVFLLRWGQHSSGTLFVCAIIFSAYMWPNVPVPGLIRFWTIWHNVQLNFLACLLLSSWSPFGFLFCYILSKTDEHGLLFVSYMISSFPFPLAIPTPPSLKSISLHVKYQSFGLHAQLWGGTSLASQYEWHLHNVNQHFLCWMKLIVLQLAISFFLKEVCRCVDLMLSLILKKAG